MPDVPTAEQVVIRLETTPDRDAVQQLITSAFHRGDDPVVEAVLNDRLRADPARRPELTLVAEDGGVVVGQLTVSNGTVRERGNAHRITFVPAIGPVAVLPGRQGEGIGSALVRHVIALAQRAGESMLVLLGSPDFYGRFGFVAASNVGIEAPDPQWGKHFQARPLRTDITLPTGRFSYSRPFDLV